MTSRSNERAPGRLKVLFRSPSSLLIAYSVNLSRGGMFIQCSQELPVLGSVLELDITLPDGNVVGLTSLVAWQRPVTDESGPRGVAVEFDTFTPEFGLLVDQMVLEYTGVTILIQCVDANDRKTLMRMLQAIISTADVIFADDEASACAQLGKQIDLLIVDVDEGEPGAIVSLAAAREHQIPTIALSQVPRASITDAADQIVANPPSNPLFRKAVLQLLSSPCHVTSAP